MSLIMSACGNSNDPTIVEVDGLELKNSSLDYQLSMMESPTDEDKDNIIGDWINQALMLAQVGDLPEKTQQEIDFKVQEYKASLVRYELENQLIKKELDTSISETELLDFYNKNKNEFELKDFIVKVLYIKVPAQAPNLNKLDNWYLLRNESDKENVQKYANKYALNFYYNEDKWIYFEDLLKEIPLEGIDKEKFIFNKTKTSFENNGTVYYLNILEYKLKNAISPFELEKENIKQRILTYRIKQIRENIYQKIITNAKKKYEVNYSN
ncbi:MAG: hypothetical protein ABI207_08685, partial [Crocinitomicaceae bacterium]